MLSERLNVEALDLKLGILIFYESVFLSPLHLCRELIALSPGCLELSSLPLNCWSVHSPCQAT